MKGDLLLTSFDKVIYRVELNGAGNAATSVSKLVDGIGQAPLDVTAQDTGELFPGTIWMVDNIGETIYVIEPADF